MFISVQQFERDMGVDQRIGRFFVDRRIPENNSFWKGRLLYIGLGNGFVSIPVFYDILFRLGIELDVLLNERHIQFMEQVMHLAILQEKNEMTKTEELRSVRKLLENRVQNSFYYELLNQYLEQPVLKPLGPFGLIHPSLNRADVFLYVLCDLPLNKEQWDRAIRYWYALHPSYLIMDDIRDYAEDKEAGEDNVVIELGDGTPGFEKTFEMLYGNSETMKEINPQLAEFFLLYEEKLRGFVPLEAQGLKLKS